MKIRQFENLKNKHIYHETNTSFYLIDNFPCNGYICPENDWRWGRIIHFRVWLSKTTGVEIFGGIATELEDINPDDVEGGFKFLHTIQYKRTDRTYFGLVGKWKWLNAFDANKSAHVPIPGILVGKEWFSKKRALKGLAVELGYQYGVKEYEIFSPFSHLPIAKERFEEFPLILNLRYSFYTKK